MFDGVIGFKILLVGWKINKGLEIGLSPLSHAKYFPKRLLMTIFIS